MFQKTPQFKQVAFFSSFRIGRKMAAMLLTKTCEICWMTWRPLGEAMGHHMADVEEYTAWVRGVFWICMWNYIIYPSYIKSYIYIYTHIWILVCSLYIAMIWLDSFAVGELAVVSIPNEATVCTFLTWQLTTQFKPWDHLVRFSWVRTHAPVTDTIWAIKYE